MSGRTRQGLAIPRVVVICGPNGAGKSTSAPGALKDGLKVSDFVNADEIARGLSAFRPETVALAAGRIMLERLHELADVKSDLAFETTLASRSFAPWIAELVQCGYEIHLIYFWLPTTEMAIARVSARVHSGGHHVPPDAVQRRYFGGIRNFFELYKPLADSWRMYNNSELAGAKLIASGGRDQNQRIYRAKDWKQILSYANPS